MKLYWVSLGCARNLVDSEIMMGSLVQAGWTLTNDPDNARVIIVNTCSFIEAAIEESIDTILQLASYKTDGCCERLVVVGCLPERYGNSICAALPEVDVFLGTGAFGKIVEAVEPQFPTRECLLPDPSGRPFERPDAPRINTSSHFAYLKVAEGCSRNCTYCIIPKLRGKYRSRSMPDIIFEADHLISKGVKELNLVAQDTTFWGKDFSPSKHLSSLLKSLSVLSDSTVWIRILYGHPDSIDKRLILTIRDAPGVLPYFDIPIQHVSSRVLRWMGRNYSMEELSRLFSTIRELLPEAVLRTTIIVGFPGETSKDVDNLLAFIHKVRFDHLGVFTYSDAEDLVSHRLSGHVSSAEANARYKTVMSAQAEISAENNRKYIGQYLDVLIEEEVPGEGVYIGRTWFQAPEVDGLTYIRLPAPAGFVDRHCNKVIARGSIFRIKISDAMEYDLVGEPA